MTESGIKGRDTMICSKCGAQVGRNRRFCEQCGADIYVALHLVRRSNLYYNEGLTRARVRDLSGAILSLKRSLEYNKCNIWARNLLGLVYFEMGETVEALSQWIISKHYEPVGNLADVYLEKVHANPTKLEAINQSIRKFNQALGAAKQGNADLAVIQLRKIIGGRPGYVRALQLLALLYIKNGEYEKARKCLLRTLKIDVANTLSLTYLAEVERAAGGNEKAAPEKEPAEFESSSYHIEPSTISLKEDKPNYIAFLTFFAGIFIGIAVLYRLVVPTVRQSIIAEYTSSERDFDAEAAAYHATISVLQNEKADLTDKLDKAQKQIDKLNREIAEQDVFDEAAYESLMFVLMEYPELARREEDAKNHDEKIQVLDEMMEYGDRLQVFAQTATERVKTEQYYRTVLDAVTGVVKERGYQYGHELYNAKKYPEAVKYLEGAYRAGREDADLLYFLGRSYQRNKENEKAKVYYEMILEKFPGTERATMAQTCLEEIK